MDFDRKKILNSIRKQNNKIISTDKKHMKSHKKKLRRMNNKLLSIGQSTSTTTGDSSAISQKKTENLYELEVKVLRKELVSLKESEKAWKIKNFNLENSVKRLTEEVSTHKKTSIRLENEKDALNSKILEDQIEIDSLKQKINEKLCLKVENEALKSEINKSEIEMINLKQIICRQNSRRFDFNSEHKCHKDNKIKELNDQLRQQRAKSRDLNHELSTCKETIRKLKEQKTKSKNSEALNRNIKKRRSSPNKKEKREFSNKVNEKIGKIKYLNTIHILCTIFMFRN